MDYCVNHPDFNAIEHCEVCQRPLCGQCLWYEEDGRRLCEIHALEVKAAGGTVLPPETYAEAIDDSLVRRPAVADSNPLPLGRTLYQGNSQDLGALIAAIVALTTLASCAGGIYCLPIFTFILGAAMYSNATSAQDPRRTRTLAGIGMGVGVLFLFFILAYVGMMVFFITFAIVMGTTAAGGAP